MFAISSPDEFLVFSVTKTGIEFYVLR